MYLYKSKIENLLFTLAFVISICAYSTWRPLGRMLEMTEEESYVIFFAGIAAAFFFYSLAFFVVKYKKWRWLPFIAWNTALARVIFEIYQPEESQKYVPFEYFFFILSCFFVFAYWLRYRYLKFIKK